MGLDRSFLSMLNAQVMLERSMPPDQWGNESFGVPETHRAFIDLSTAVLGTGVDGQLQDKKSVRRQSVLTDAIGVTVGDRMTYNGAAWYVTEVQTTQDEDGSDLYQESSVEDQKKG